jgi:hypothetical protein
VDKLSSHFSAFDVVVFSGKQTNQERSNNLSRSRLASIPRIRMQGEVKKELL